MIIADLAEIAGRSYPARRRTQNLVGGASPIQAKSFSMGCVTLEPHGGQVPWHNQEQEEIYLILEGEGEMCLGTERTAIKAGQAVYIPPQVFHQLTNTGSTTMRMIYCYGPAGAERSMPSIAAWTVKRWDASTDKCIVALTFEADGRSDALADDRLRGLPFVPSCDSTIRPLFRLKGLPSKRRSVTGNWKYGYLIDSVA